MSALTIRGLTVALGGRRVLDGLDLQVPTGELVAVLGPSGCGKTTLLRAIAGFAPVSAGTVRIGDRVVADGRRGVAPEARGVGLVPQEGALFPHLDVAGNVGFGLPRGERRGSRRVSELLDLVGLAGFERRRPAELSGGQQQRVALARALAPRPGLVLLDEPFSALDTGLRAGLRADVRAVLHAAGATAVIVTHDQDEALSMADRIAILDAGRILMHATPGQIYARPRDLRVARFVGQGSALSAVVVGGRARTALGEIVIEPASGPDAAVDGEGTVWLRPEQIGIASHGVAARVLATEYRGHETISRVRLTDGVVVLVRSAAAPEGPDVCLRVTGPARFFPAPPEPAGPVLLGPA